ncbi:MAG: hypothetical protein KJ041_06940 [Gammaproteobacteria bacterium]|nr:hypothetical protein [Gammaproteobacteria bacterium]
MNRMQRACCTLGVVSCGLTGCSDTASSSPSGLYVAEMQGDSMEINFLDEGKATFGMTEGGLGETVDCTYQAGETLITLSCYGSSGITLTRVKGGLEADMGGVLVRYQKR